jgi:uncharacterized protein (UPF0261 family)
MSVAEMPKIVVAGILDTKAKEILFIADRIRAMGGDPSILELSVGREVGWADISVSETLRKIGRDTEEIFTMERAKAADVIVEGAIHLISELLERGEMAGMIACGGSLGTSMATRIMQTLPIGIPKLMLSTMASGDVRPYVGTRDIAMLYPIAEAGLNAITRKVFNNAAAAIVGMASALSVPPTETKPLIGCMMFGATTPASLRASNYFEEKGYELMINHAVGSGGRAMEDLITEGHIVGMLDITTHEVVAQLLGGVLSAGPDRLTAAGRKGIPQVVSTGGLDMIVFGPRDTVPRELEEEEIQGVVGRVIHDHNPAISFVGLSLNEAYMIGQHMAYKMNSAEGPTVICIPLRGWGAYDVAAPNLNLGWAGPGPGPIWVADPERPEWSLRARRFTEGLHSKIDFEKPNLDVVIVDRHMNEPEFADLMAQLLDDMLSGTWKKGGQRNWPNTVQLR